MIIISTYDDWKAVLSLTWRALCLHVLKKDSVALSKRELEKFIHKLISVIYMEGEPWLTTMQSRYNQITRDRKGKNKYHSIKH